MTEINSIKPSETFMYNKHPVMFYTEYSPFPLFCRMVERYNWKFVYHCVVSSVSEMELMKAKKISIREIYSLKMYNYLITADVGFSVEKIMKMFPSKIPGEYMIRENLYFGDFV